MFKIAKNHTFRHEVAIFVPVNGGFDKQTLQCTYRALSDEELAGFDMNTHDGQLDFLRATIARLDDLVTEEGDALEYSDDVREQVIGQVYARTALIAGFTDAMVKGRVGN